MNTDHAGRRSDDIKFAYHEGARIMRAIQDRVCEITYTAAPPDEDECEALCDMLIELHQLLYEVTLFTFRTEDLLEEEADEDD